MAGTNTKKKSNTGIIATVVVVIIVIAFLAYVFGRGSSSPYGGGGYSSTPSTVPQIYTIDLLSQGQVFSINAGGYYGVNFTVPSGSYSINVTGSYTSQGKVEVAILTPAQYGAFSQNQGSIASSQYYYGDTQGSTINAQLSAGQYTLIFYDPGIITQDTVTVVNPIVAHYTN
jgi:hypothetical protein